MSEKAKAVSASKKPPSWLLIALNGSGYFLLSLFSFRWPFALILAPISTLYFLVVSGIWQGFVLLFERRWRLIPVLRTCVFLLPLITALVMPHIGTKLPQKVNRQRPALSADGNYTAVVSAPGHYWTIEISGTDGSKFKETTDFVGHLSVYWLWDANGRLWIYNSDDGAVHFWERNTEFWQHKEWGWGGVKQIAMEVQPPSDLYPDYAKDN